MSRYLSLVLSLLIAAPAWAQSQSTSPPTSPPAPKPWPEKSYNPKPMDDDLVLPMPCGGAMAFRPIEVPVKDWLDDRRIVVGGLDDRFDFKEGARYEYMSGGFTDADNPTRRLFWLAKYETSQLQWAALHGSCDAPSIRRRIPQVKTNWYDAVDAAQRYNEWLYKNAFDKLPKEDGAAGFLRLPTEAEWEYGARGGVAVGTAEFDAQTFPVPDGLVRYVWYQGTESANGKLRPGGLKQPNPLGLFDMLGNAEEIVLEPFRLNKLSRLHGQAGGFITKGGHYLTPKLDIRSAYRQEYAHFDSRKRAPREVQTIGFRLALISTVIPSRERLKSVQQQWRELPASKTLGEDVQDDPVQDLGLIIQATTDIDLRDRLKRVSRNLKENIGLRNEQRDRSVKSQVRLGAFLGNKIKDDHRRVQGVNKLAQGLEDLAAKQPNNPQVTERLERFRRAKARGEELLNQTVLYYADNVIQTSSDSSGEVVTAQLQKLLVELKSGQLKHLAPFASLFVDHVESYRQSRSADRDAWLQAIVGQ